MIVSNRVDTVFWARKHCILRLLIYEKKEMIWLEKILH